MAFCLAAAALSFSAKPASAAFHEILVREVFAGAAANTSYVVLQAYNSGQNAVNTHDVIAYGPAATGQIGTFEFTSNVSNGANQMTILVGDTASTGPARDGTMSTLDLDPAGGAVCWNGTPDCVSWGNFSGSPLSATGTPVLPGGIPGGMAIRRKITAGCATKLEPFPTDDSNDSAADFEEVSPNPRNNMSTITETDCTTPNTTITGGPANSSRTQSTEASFSFTATPSAGASFECKLDTGGFGACSSPQMYSPLDGDDTPGGTSHNFQVRAKNATGTDSTPDSRTWTVDTVNPTTTITKQPVDPSSGGSAFFAFKADETASFKCILEGPKPSPLGSCTSNSTSTGKTYTSLSDGSYTFKVYATDLVGREGGPDEYTWTVNNSLKDETPPETTIKSKPPDPSSSTTAEFTYESTEANSTFECRMDGESFSPCPPSGKTYSGLGAGPHTFQVRATDESLNTDPEPAGYSFSIVLPVQSEVKPPEPTPVVPNTTITTKPKAKTKDRTPTFKFKSSIPGASYECKLDGKALRPCRSPLTTKPLSYARHTLKVAAIAGGLKDNTPAVAAFKVVKPK